MPSKAFIAFCKAREHSRLLVDAARDKSSLVYSKSYKDTCLHAALAILVAAWEAYLEKLVVEAQTKILDPSQKKYSAVLGILMLLTTNDVKRFNTPNSEKSRNLLISHTGYDPINDWQWPAKSLNGPQARQQLDDILKIRHSFAHGFSIPNNISWIKVKNAEGSLNITILKQVDGFLSRMVKATDDGMANHLKASLDTTSGW